MTVSEFINKVGFKVDEASVNAVNQSMNQIKSTAAKVLGVIGIGISLASLNAVAEEFGLISQKIRNAVDESEDFRAVSEGILQAANNSRVAYATMTDSVIGLKEANSEVFPLDQATEFAEYLVKVGKNAGYTEAQIAQMSKGVEKLVSAADITSNSLRTLGTQAPAFIDQLCDSIGVTKDELYAMADAGEISAETIRDAVVGAAGDIDKSFSELNFTISEALQHIRNRWGFWVDDMNQTFKISQFIGNIMVKSFDKLMDVLGRVREGFVKFADLVGGSENMLKLIAVAAAAFVVAMNWSKIVAGANAFLNALRALFSIGGLKALGFLAIVMALFLIIDDFINFMQGNDSVLGYAFEQAGIDAEEMRQKIINIWNNIKTFFAGVWAQIKAIFAPVINFIEERLKAVFGDDLFEGLGNGMAGVIEFLDRLTSKLAESEKAQKIFAGLAVAIGGLVVVVPIIKRVIGAFSGIKSVTETVTGLGKGASNAGGLVSSAGSKFLKMVPGLLALGAAALMIATAFALLAQSAIAIASAGTGAQVAMAVMAAGAALLVAGLVALGPAATASAVGLLAVGAAVLMISVGIAVVVAAFSLFASMLPTIATYGASGAVALLQLAGALTVFGAGAAVAGAGALAASVGLAALAVAGVAAAAAALLLAGGLVACGAAVMVLGAGLSLTAAGLAMMAAGAAASVASMLPLAGGLTAVGAAALASSAGLLTSSAGLGAMALAASAAAVPTLLLSAGLTVVAGAVSRIASGSAASASGLASMAAGFTAAAASSAASSGTMSSSFSGAASAIVAGCSAIVGAVSSMASGVQSSMNGSSSSTAAARGAISGSMNQIRSVVTATGSAASSAWTSAMSRMQSGTSSSMSGMSSNVKSAINTIRSTVSGAASSAYSWGSHLGSNLASGIRSQIPSIKAAANAAAQAASKPLKHSVPEEGPLKDETTWMPHMMQNLAQGINDNKDVVKAAMSGVAQDVSVMSEVSTVSPSTTATAMGAVSNNRTVNQNVVITNTFNGERAIQEKAAKIMDKSGEDITAQLARGLAYGG